IFYTHYRPHLAHRDMGDLKARVQSIRDEIVVTQQFARMFPESSGEEEVRAMVY
ncbi:hypothetical protein GG344DRAFT_22167, partial [Lentinula edodes]